MKWNSQFAQRKQIHRIGENQFKLSARELLVLWYIQYPEVLILKDLEFNVLDDFFKK